MVMENEEVLSYKDVVLRRSDLDVLEGPCYLNDQIISLYFSYLTASSNAKDVFLVPPSVSFWLANCPDPENIKDSVDPLKLSSWNLVLFAVNDNEDLGGGDGGTHWSLLAFDRNMNAFIHHDGMEGVNHCYALKLFDYVKGFMGGSASSLVGSSSSKLSSKGKNKKKKDLGHATNAMAVPSALPSFIECQTPQQTNGYDCGLYVMTIARVICQWYAKKPKGTDNWFSSVEKHVTASLEMTMRPEVMRLIEDLKTEG